MLGSLGIILLIGICFAEVTKKLKMPNLVGMIIAGIVIGPYGLNLITESILNMSGDIRKFALVIIIIRAGLNINVREFKMFGKTSKLLAIIPALFEMTIITLIAIIVFNFNIFSAIILAIIISAVSPAIVVPKMISLVEQGKNRIPQLIIASATIENILIITLFSIIIVLSSNATTFTIIYVIIGIVSGVVAGCLIGFILLILLKNRRIPITIYTLLILAFAFLFIGIEKNIEYFNSLIAIILMAVVIGEKSDLKPDFQIKFKEIWTFAKILLFVIVGSSLDITSAFNNIIIALVIITFGLLFRSIGVLIALRGSNFINKEKIFIVIAFIPKATVQAALAPIVLTLNISNSDTILNVAVFSILISAPFGAFLIDKYKHNLS